MITSFSYLTNNYNKKDKMSNDNKTLIDILNITDDECKYYMSLTEDEDEDEEFLPKHSNEVEYNNNHKRTISNVESEQIKAELIKYQNSIKQNKIRKEDDLEKLNNLRYITKNGNVNHLCMLWELSTLSSNSSTLLMRYSRDVRDLVKKNKEKNKQSNKY